MRPRDLDLETQGQGHTKVTNAKSIAKMRFSPDCEHAECGAIGIAIAIFKFCIYHVFRVKKKMSLFAFLRILALIAIAPNLAQIILRTLRRAGRFTFLNFYLGQVRRHFEFFFLIQSHSNESYFVVPVEHQPVKSHQTLYT